jgi:type VI secretion system secreted protein VgrG
MDTTVGGQDMAPDIMPHVECGFSERSIRVECRSLEGRERLGECAEFDLGIIAALPIDGAAVLRKPCAISIVADTGTRIIHGVVTRFTALATSQAEGARRYRLSVRSPLALLEHRRRARVFQNLSVPEIVRQVVVEGGYPAGDVRFDLRCTHDPLPYVVQYGESDLALIRRLCEEEGLYFRFDDGDDGDVFMLEDTSSAAPAGLRDPLSIVDETAMSVRSVVAFACRSVRKRRPGKVTARDYDYEHPAIVPEGEATAGNSFEAAQEVYAAPPRFGRPGAVSRSAALLLESLRAEALSVHFRTTAVALAPGRSLELERTSDISGAAQPEGKHLVVGLEHRWSIDSQRYELEVRAIPLKVPYRLPRVTPRPMISGLHSAIVTGAPGEEIHTDEQGRIRVRFFWDREGSGDDKSSLPVRVMQPNLPGSMVLPRVGWEVLVMFEDGDPDRPVVLGRAYNAKQPPPHSLPANKTMTSLATYSSPGGGAHNAITFDDAVGRQHFALNAALGKTLSVGGNMVVQTAHEEKHGVKGSHSRSVGGKEDVSVGQAYFVSADAQSASVGGAQKIYVKGDMSIGVGSEAVTIGGALLEQVGNPASGAANLAFSALMFGASSVGAAGAVFASACGLAKGAIEGTERDGPVGGSSAAGMGLLGMAVGMVPGGDAILAAVQGAAGLAPWDEREQDPGSQEAGGGAGGGASDASGPKGPGPGHRNTQVKGPMMESIGAVYSVTTPGSISWLTAGASTILVGGSHSTATARANFTTAGASSETVGCLQIKSKGSIERIIKGPMSTSIGGALMSGAAGKHSIKTGGALTLRVGGSLTLSGAHVTFECGGSKLSASPGGVLIEASTIKLMKASRQSAKATHT